MAYEQRDNSGSMFRNDKKEKDTHPDYKGTATIDGTEYWMDAWLKVSESGRKWMSFSFKAKEAKPAPKPAKKAPVQDDFDDVPF